MHKFTESRNVEPSKARNPEIAISRIRGLTRSNIPIPQNVKSQNFIGAEHRVIACGHVEGGARRKAPIVRSLSHRMHSIFDRQSELGHFAVSRIEKYEVGSVGNPDKWSLETPWEVGAHDRVQVDVQSLHELCPGPKCQCCHRRGHYILQVPNRLGLILIPAKK